MCSTEFCSYTHKLRRTDVDAVKIYECARITRDYSARCPATTNKAQLHLIVQRLSVGMISTKTTYVDATANFWRTLLSS